MGWKTSKDTWVVTVHDPDDKTETAEVTLRHLNFGEDRRLARIPLSDDGGAFEIGEQQLRKMKLSIVSWTLPQPLTDDEIEELDPRIGDQISEAIELGPLTKAEAALPPTNEKNGSADAESVTISTSQRKRTTTPTATA